MNNLRFENCTIGREENCLVKNFSANFDHSDTIVLLGKNGVGKTTFFKSLLGTLPLLKGEIFYNNLELSRLNVQKRAKVFSFLLTARNFDMFLKVEDLLKLGRFPYIGNWGRLEKNDYMLIDEFVALFGIKEFLYEDFNCLSDGERQKCLLARTFIQDCPNVFLDEPGSYLDIKNKLELFLMIRDIAKDKDKRVIFSTHDIESVSKVFSSFLFLDDSKRELTLSDHSLFTSSPFKKAFSSEKFYFDQARKTFEFTVT